MCDGAFAERLVRVSVSEGEEKRPLLCDRKTHLILTSSRATCRLGIRDLVIGNYLSPSSFTSIAKNKYNLIFSYKI